MIVKFNWSELGRQKQSLAFLTDIAMIGLIFLNLGFIIFDWYFDIPLIQDVLKQIVPSFFHFYNDNIHPNFYPIDGVFVTIFISELIVRWGIAIYRKTFDRWFFYPFVYWYDVLGCIPLGSFRWLRILRLVSMTIRLHKMRVLNIRETYAYKKGMKYYGIIVEEVSDRVILNALTGVQREIESSTPITDRMITEVIRPHKDTLTDWVSHRVRKVTADNYAIYRVDIKQYVEECVARALLNNQEVKNLKMIPVVGRQISKALEHSVSVVTFNVMDGMMNDLASPTNSKLIDELAEIIFEAVLYKEDDQELDKVAREVIINSLELVKEQVAIKQWQQAS